jgi:hypothetical protein
MIEYSGDLLGWGRVVKIISDPVGFPPKKKKAFTTEARRNGGKI